MYGNAARLQAQQGCRRIKAVGHPGAPLHLLPTLCSPGAAASSTLGLIEACEAAHRRLTLHAVGYERPVMQEAAVARLLTSCADWVDVELVPI